MAEMLLKEKDEIREKFKAKEIKLNTEIEQNNDLITELRTELST